MPRQVKTTPRKRPRQDRSKATVDTIRIGPGQTARLQFTTGVAESRDQAMALVRTYHDPRSGHRAMDMAWTASQIELRDLGLTPDEAVV